MGIAVSKESWEPAGMTMHLIKLCVGAHSVDDLARWQAANRQYWRQVEGRACVFHTTAQTPRLRAALLDGGSLYWVIRGVIQARQRLVGFDEGHKENGSACCLLLLDPTIVAVQPVVRRAFQGWRYLPPDEAPPDLAESAASDVEAMPAALRRDLAELCLI